MNINFNRNKLLPLAACIGFKFNGGDTTCGNNASSTNLSV